MKNIDIPALLQLAKEARAECSDKRGTLLNEHLIVPLYEAVEALAREIDRLHQFYQQRNMDREHAREARSEENALREKMLKKAEARIKEMEKALTASESTEGWNVWIEVQRERDEAVARVAVLREALIAARQDFASHKLYVEADRVSEAIATCDADADKLRERLKAIDTLYDAIAHGDDNHRNWLRGKIDEHFGCAPSEEGGDAG